MDLLVAGGESRAIMGPSGSGKTTLMHVLSGILTPDAGQVLMSGPSPVEISGLKAEARARLRRERIGFVFQEGLLMPELTAAENVAMPLMLAGVSRSEAEVAAGDWLARLGLAGMGDRRPAQLSGGQQQRVAIARAQITEPDVVFADEPTGALDSTTSEQVLTALLESTVGRGAPLVVVTHDPAVAARCSRVVRLEDGRMPVVGLLPFAGSPMGVEGLWLGPGLLAAACAVLLGFSVLAAFSGLRRVQVTPLGVRTRQRSQKVWRGRAVLAGLGVVLVFVLHNMVPIRSEWLMLVVAFVFLAVPLLAVQLVGPWLLKVITARQARRATTAQRLIAARNVLESPQQMWRQVGGMAIAAFVGVIAGSGTGLIAVGMETNQNAEDLMFFGDVQRGVWLNLAVAFLMTTCSVGLNQTAQILDRRDLYSGLAKMGLTAGQLNRIRSLSVMRSLAAVLITAVVSASIVAFPIVGWAILSAPATVAVVAAVLAAGVLLIRCGLLATRPTLQRVIAAG
ncbi:ABC transporter ATP-binding protein [Nesterenkonia sedimenti]|uniref:ABC transporter ATP-binding protein n=1 Tax=Nesterenkonia sedimenti TaxID=1463632 RepID=UPI002D21C21D|nr:ABC transporter ATP-binding protein [Nesterenkonia sedimenti]